MDARQRSLFLEHCYESTGPLDVWLGGVTRTLAPLIAEREGLMVNGGAMGAKPSIASACGTAESLLGKLDSYDATPADIMEKAYRPFTVTLLSNQFADVPLRLEDPYVRDSLFLRELQFTDAIGMMASVGMHRFVVTVPLRAGHTRSHQEPGLRQMRRHLQSGIRGVLQGTSCQGDIVADREGRILSASRGASDSMKEIFKAAAVAHDAERRGKVPAPDAERVWQELWKGGWALDEFSDSDGKRMLLLRKDPSNANAHRLDASEQRALTQLARGAAYKVIASDLGIAVSTASEIVERALRKLGFKSRVDFIGHFAQQT